MKKLLFIISFLLLFGNSYSQSIWSTQNSGTVNDLRFSYFVNQQTGWAVGFYYTIVKTTNRGLNWITQDANTYQSFVSVYFINDQTGWASGGTLSAEISTISKTTNGGQNWDVVYSSTIGLVFKTVFVSQNLGFSVTSKGYILKSTDLGSTWNTIFSNMSFCFTQCCFLNQNTGWVIGDYGTILNTTDGGNNWLIQNSNTSDNLEGIYFSSVSTGYIVGTNGKILKTTNSGQNWISKSANTTYWLNSICFINNNTGYIVGGNAFLNDSKNISSTPVMFRTNNGGENWISQNTPATSTLAVINFVNDQTGWAVGRSGTIIKTTNAGSVFIKNINTNLPFQYSLNQNYPNPFNPSTIIRYQIKDLRFVTLKVYDILGKEIATLVNEKLQPGTYEVPFSINQFSGYQIPSGIYFYTLRAGDYVETKKMLMIK